MGRGKFTVNEVEERTSVPAATLRQCERRYGFPMPERSEAGYRLYSEDDVRSIDAMKRHIADGVPASRAAELVKHLPDAASSGEGRPASMLRDALVAALVDLDDHAADRVMGEAHALHPVESVMVDILQPAMLELGQRWHDGTIATTTEHFASSYVQGRLRALLSLAGQHRRSPGVVVACAPLDQHELGALMLAVMLRRAGYRAYFVGANTPVEDLAIMARDLRPFAVMISASSLDSIHQLAQKREHLEGIAPVLALGGHGFNADPSRVQELGGHYLAASVVAAVDRFDELVKSREVDVA